MSTARISTERRWILGLAALTFAVRLAVVLHAGERPLGRDETTYDGIAWNIVSGHGYVLGHTATDRHPTALRGPAYVLYVASFYAVAGHRVVPPLAGQCMLESLTGALVFWLARRWSQSARVGLVAQALVAVYPPFVQLAASLLTETLSSFAVIAAVAAFVRHLDTRRARDLVLSGMALGVCALGKPQLGPVALLLPLSAVRELGGRDAARAAAVLALVAALILSPWIVRNAVVFRAFVPGVTNAGVGIWGGAAPYGGRFAGAAGDPWVPDTVRRALSGLDEMQQNKWFLRDARRVIASDPWRYVRLSGRKVLQLWLNLGFDDPPSRASLALAAFNLAAFLLAFLGARRGAEPGAAHTVVLLGVYWTVAHVPFTPVIRYAMPYLGLLFCLTAAGLVLPRFRETRGRT